MLKFSFVQLFCCEQAKQMRELILEEREQLAQRESDRKIDVTPHVPIRSEEERETAKKQARERRVTRVTRPCISLHDARIVWKDLHVTVHILILIVLYCHKRAPLSHVLALHLTFFLQNITNNKFLMQVETFENPEKT